MTENGAISPSDPAIRVSMPDADMAQDSEWCDVHLPAGTRRVRFHDYDEIYAIPGLYEHLFYDLLRCTSPATLADMLAAQMDADGIDPATVVAPEERAHLGVFLSFQYPVEIPGVTVSNFIKTAINESKKARGEEPMDASSMLKKMREKMDLLEMDKGFLSRSLNEGFSGGEKKRNEIFQMAMLEPTLAILDETDSGLDIDALRIVANGVNALRSPQNAFMVITHYQRLLDHIVPDYVHVLFKGKIVKSGDKSLALDLEERGYDWIKKEQE